MKSEELYEAVTGLDDRFVLEARRREIHWKPWAGLAAALVLVAVSWPMFLGFFAVGGGNAAAPSAPSGGNTPAASAPAASAPAEPEYEDYAAEIQVAILEDTVELTNPTDQDWTGMVHVLGHDFEATIPAGETVTLDLEDLP